MFRHRHPAFTFFELLIVIGIIAVLCAILIPAVAKARRLAQQTQCQNNVRALLIATHEYVLNDPAGRLPGANWAIVALGSPNPPGWLFADNNGTSGPHNPHTGELWRLVGDDAVYHCPLHPPYDSFNGPCETATSYLINGAICGYGRAMYPSLPLTSFKNTSDDILFFECSTHGEDIQRGLTTPMGGSFIGGASFPNGGWNVSGRHGLRSTVGYLDWHAESIGLDEYQSDLAITTAPDPVFCFPFSANGR